jgi:hypothetical protein
MDSVVAALRTVRTDVLTSRTLLWSALVVPLVAWLIAWVLLRHQPRAKRFAHSWATLTLSTPYSFVAVLFVTCFIGDAGKQQLGRALAAPVVIALGQYETATGVYPDSLAQLAPTYLSSETLHAPERSLHQRPFGYARDRVGFTLSFYYIGPGANTCDLSPGRPWSCGGFY